MPDIKSPRLLWLKFALLILLGLLSSGIILYLHPTLLTAALLAIAIWAFCRAYYFAFYVIERYIDTTYRFAGLTSLIRYAIRNRNDKQQLMHIWRFVVPSRIIKPASTRKLWPMRKPVMHSDSLFDLSPSEKLQLVEDLWDDLAAIPSDIPVHDWQKEELARRKANLQSQPTSGVSWQDVKARIRSRYGR
jgi:putative addiction module component (TIGR02574 family)